MFSVPGSSLSYERQKENDDYEKSEEDGKEAGEEGEIIGDDPVQVGEAPWPGRGALFLSFAIRANYPPEPVSDSSWAGQIGL
jgi:hypothetical protein